MRRRSQQNESQQGRIHSLSDLKQRFQDLSQGQPCQPSAVLIPNLSTFFWHGRFLRFISLLSSSSSLFFSFPFFLYIYILDMLCFIFYFFSCFAFFSSHRLHPHLSSNNQLQKQTKNNTVLKKLQWLSFFHRLWSPFTSTSWCVDAGSPPSYKPS